MIHMFINSMRTYKKSITNNWKSFQIEVKVYQERIESKSLSNEIKTNKISPVKTFKII
jgi:hypothetical protein